MVLSMPFRLQMPQSVRDALIAQALAEQPNECCGLLGGVIEAGISRVVCAYPLPNALADPRLFQADTRALLRAHVDMRERNLEMLAVYHSHPTSPAVPSATDHAQWGHGEAVVCLIITLLENPPSLRGWWMSDQGESREAEYEVVG